METITIVIEKTKDLYTGYAENCEGIYAAGNSVEAVMADASEAIRLIKANLPRERWPEQIKGNYELRYRLEAVRARL